MKPQHPLRTQRFVDDWITRHVLEMNLNLLLFTVALCLLSHNGEPVNTSEPGAIVSKSKINIALSLLRRVFGVFQVGNM